MVSRRDVLKMSLTVCGCAACGALGVGASGRDARADGATAIPAPKVAIAVTTPMIGACLIAVPVIFCLLDLQCDDAQLGGQREDGGVMFRDDVGEGFSCFRDPDRSPAMQETTETIAALRDTPPTTNCRYKLLKMARPLETTAHRRQRTFQSELFGRLTG